METVLLLWDAVVGASGYNLYRSQDSLLIGSKVNGSLIIPSGTATESFSDSVLSGAVYFYRVTSVLDGVESMPSEAIRVSVGLPQDITPKRAAVIAVEERGNPN